MKRHSRMFQTFFAFTLIISLTSCQFIDYLFEDIRPAVEIEQEKYFRIDSTTILDSISNGKEDIFVPIDKPTSIEDPSSKQIYVKWQQEDYLKVASVVISAYFDSSIDDWEFEEMDFSFACEDECWPQSALFNLYQIDETDEMISRLMLIIRIFPGKEYVYAYKVRKTPNIWSLESIILDEISIPVEEAICIAEQNGGKNARDEALGELRIYANIQADVEYQRWMISYYDDSSKRIFYMLVNPTNGYFSLQKEWK